MAQENESKNMKRIYANARDVLPSEVLDAYRSRTPDEKA